MNSSKFIIDHNTSTGIIKNIYGDAVFIHPPHIDPYKVMENNGECYEDIICLSLSLEGANTLFKLLEDADVSQVEDLTLVDELSDTPYTVTPIDGNNTFSYDDWKSAVSKLAIYYGIN